MTTTRRSAVGRGNVFGTPRTDHRDFWNLHEAFLNAVLQHRYWADARNHSRNPNDVERFRRMWIGFLAVLIEAWRSRQMQPGVAYMQRLTSCAKLETLLAQAEKDGLVAWMTSVRDLVFHLNRSPRPAVGVLALSASDGPEELYQAFSEAFLAAMESNRRGRRLDLLSLLRHHHSQVRRTA